MSSKQNFTSIESTLRASRREMLSGATEALKEISLDQLRVSDQVVIQTRHSTYIFLVSDPAQRLGLLVGGVLGDYAAEAVLEMLPFAQDYRLREGRRVRFLIESSAGIRIVITSAITRLIHRRTGIE